MGVETTTINEGMSSLVTRQKVKKKLR